ncbi:fliN: flagellar motor switch protein FliN [Gaiella occulta]|uniref:FliN: flagellar motor switch protein FliN n=1 Tax=Gaiella occulta TaxID=1002870 RepID=A0A7M2Z2L8_9ACTN|nr:flagellar motor switch protein FliN [Gaiella occulta]RDI75993.1 fliN: flagellar motor switch protein FliN [Gaiella occulta]
MTERGSPIEETEVAAAPATPEPANAHAAPELVGPADGAAVTAPLSRGSGDSLADVGALLDVPLDVTVELGRAQLSIRDFAALAPGSVVGLDKLAGEALDILVNGKLLARGEVVVIDDEFGVRITEIVTAQDRHGDPAVL